MWSAAWVVDQEITPVNYTLAAYKGSEVKGYLPAVLGTGWGGWGTGGLGPCDRIELHIIGGDTSGVLLIDYLFYET